MLNDVYHPQGLYPELCRLSVKYCDEYNLFLIVCDFNIHMCCETRPLVRDFLDLVDSFHLTQSVTGPAQEKEHTLDLVLSFGLCVQTMKSVTHVSQTIYLFYFLHPSV